MVFALNPPTVSATSLTEILMFALKTSSIVKEVILITHEAIFTTSNGRIPKTVNRIRTRDFQPLSTWEVALIFANR